MSIAQKEFTQLFPQAGWVEHDPREIWASQIGVAIEALGRAGLKTRDVAAIGITNQRETTIVWDRDTGEPVYNAIVWQDRRTAEYLRTCESRRRESHHPGTKPGLLIDAYFSASKIDWILDNVPGARERAARGELAFGTVDTWLVWKLTGGDSHVTDVTNASRTMLFNIHTGEWDEELLRLFDVPASLLPEVRASSDVYGAASTSLGLGDIPIGGVAGDQQAALFGQMCRKPGMSKNTYGTGCFLLQNVGTTPRAVPESAGDDRRLENRRAHRVRARGQRLHWRRGRAMDSRRPGPDPNRGGHRASRGKRADNGGVFLVPAFAGLGAPHWDPIRARHDRRPHARHDCRAHRARGAREHRVPGGRLAGCDGGRLRHRARRNCASTAAPRPTTR